ncbi:MAG: hypothetical protein WC775_03705 [Patescibacteria group bacterium]|jgi:hypothetical protein
MDDTELSNKHDLTLPIVYDDKPYRVGFFRYLTGQNIKGIPSLIKALTDKTKFAVAHGEPYVYMQSPNYPSQRFSLSPAAISRAKEMIAQLGRELTCVEVARLCVEDTSNTVQSQFSPDACNAANVSFYASEQYDKHYWVVLFNNPIINIALGKFFFQILPQNRKLRLGEWGAGNTGEKWQSLLRQLTSGGTVTLMDFKDRQTNPPGVPEGWGAAREKQNLLEPLPNLPEDKKFDAIVCSYTFDSIWAPGDMRLVYKKGQWYQVLTRLRIPDNHPRKEELLAALKAGAPLSNPTSKDYAWINVEELIVPVDINKIPYGSIIDKRGRAAAERMHPEDEAAVNVPGGLIAKVVEAFDKQLTRDGVCVIGDVVSGEPGFQSSAVNETNHGALYKVEDYYLAAKILREVYAFDASVNSVHEMVGKYAGATLFDKPSGKIDSDILTSQRYKDQCFLIVRRK